MPAPQTTILTLREYEPTRFRPEQLPEAAARLLHTYYHEQVDVQPPSFRTQGQWQLTARGWIGYIPLTAELALSLQPKTALVNLFGMLEVAYNLQSFRFLDGLFDAATLDEFYERLAHILARRILDRMRKGLYQTYIAQADRLPYVRGRLDLQPMFQQPEQAEVHCQYEEQTGDVEENQILAWTLHRILHSGLCTEQRAQPSVRQALRMLQSTVTLRPFAAQVCLQRSYNRLNHDYHPLHALCYFFLDERGPSHEAGGRQMLPFLVNMARLYERFVAEWLKANLDPKYGLKIQDRYAIGSSGPHFNIDLVVVEQATGEVRWVMDTKYRTPGATPSADEIAQVIAYAEAKGAAEAILIYPVAPARPLDQTVGAIRVRSLTFALDRPLDAAGQAFLNALQM